MADKRKLQAEIDRCIKKVQEGIEEFDEIWAKVQEATHPNQKEKYETDLKKEIKKLQRQREQIKGWLNSNEIKDKSQLQEYRRIIEQKMEQFKVVERETKTKAYSKQGLGAEQKLDPKEKEKEETIGWLQECIDRLSQQNDKFESEIEQLSASAGKKKKLDKDKQERLDELRRALERHKYHIQKIELLMRLLTNNSLESNQVVKIRDDLEYYIVNNQDQDFEENEFMYDDLNLGDVEQIGNVGLGGLDESENNSETNTTASVSPSASPAPSHNSKDSNKGSDEIKLRHTSGEEVIKPVVSRPSITSISRSTPTTPLKLTSQTSVESALSTPPLNSTPPPPPQGLSYNSVAAGTKSASKVLSVVGRTTSEPPLVAPLTESTPPKFDASTPPALQQSLSTSSSSSFQSATTAPPAVAQQQVGSYNAPSQPVAIVQPLVTSSPIIELLSSTSNNLSSTLNGPVSDIKQLEDETSVLSLKSLAEKVAATTSASIPSSVNLSSSVTSAITPATLMQSSNISNTSVGESLLRGLTAFNNSNAALANALQSQQTQEAKIPPSLGASPLGKIPLTQDHLLQLNSLENAMHHMPMPADSERLRNYLPRSPCQVPPHYPQSPPPMADVLEYFNRLHNETLFFIFYYMEGTRAQYLAAKALKRQSWRFHTKYMMWFQRHEEPKTITDEFEQGTYIYFDFEKWAQRKKEGFTFEYRFLEDKEMA